VGDGDVAGTGVPDWKAGCCGDDWAWVLPVANKPKDKQTKKITFLMKHWFNDD